MIKRCGFLRKILVTVVAIFFALPGFAQSGDIGDYGMWATEYNQKLVNGAISQDLKKFSPDATDITVPIEAKLGLMFMKALSSIDYILQNSLVSFTIIFLLITATLHHSPPSHLKWKAHSY